jgi:hypothetical protein
MCFDHGYASGYESGLEAGQRDRAELMARIQELTAENERLGEVVRQRTFLLDQQMGTPCEQIRLQQEVERLTTRYVCETCRDNPYLCSTIPTSHCAKAEVERLRAALRAISTTSIWTGDAGSQQTYEGVRAYARDALNPPSDPPDD